MRMLQNNLDPDVAERPQDSSSTAAPARPPGTGRANRALIRTLTTLKDDETMLVQSGRPVGVFRTHEWAPRVLIANSNLVPDWATWPEFRRLEKLGLTMYGQMTAGSWIYIGTPGHPAGHVRDLRRRGGQALRRHPGRHADADRRLRRHGRRAALAVTMNDGVCLIIDIDETRLRRRSRRATWTRWPIRWTTASPGRSRPRRRARRCPSACRTRDPRSRDPARGRRGRIVTTRPRPTTRWPTSRRAIDLDDRADYAPRSRRVHRPGPRVDGQHVEAMVGSWTPAPRCSTTATPSAARPSWAGNKRAFAFPGFVPA